MGLLLGLLRFLTGTFSGDEDNEAACVWYEHATKELKDYAKPLVGKRVSITYMSRFQGPRQAALVLKHALRDIGAIIVQMDDDADVRVEIRGSGGPATFTLRGESVPESRQRECHPDLLISSIIQNLVEMFRGT
jgi:hypothetical protein